MNLNQNQNQGQPHGHPAMGAYSSDASSMQGKQQHAAYGNCAPLRTTTTGSTGSTSNLASKKTGNASEDGLASQDARIARGKDNAGGQMRVTQAPTAANYLNNDLVCTHLIAGRQTKKNCPVGDTHLMNCNMCGAFFPKTSALTIRSTAR